MSTETARRSAHPGGMVRAIWGVFSNQVRIIAGSRPGTIGALIVAFFALVALLAAVLAFLGDLLGTPWLLIVGLGVVGVMIVAAYGREAAYTEPGTTTVTALLVCFGLGLVVPLAVELEQEPIDAGPFPASIASRQAAGWPAGH